MSIDRIAEIKRKIMTRKRATIKGDDDYNPEVPQVEVRRSQWIHVLVLMYISGARTVFCTSCECLF